MGLREGALVGDEARLLFLRGVEEIDKVELSVRLPALHCVESGNVVGWQGMPSGDLDKSEPETFSCFGGAVAAPDEFGADERIVTGEIEVEVVGFVEVAEGGDDGVGFGGGTEPGSKYGEVVSAALPECAEDDAFAEGFDDGMGLPLTASDVTGPGVGEPDLEVVGEAGGEGLEVLWGADIESGVGPEAGQPQVAEVPVLAGQDDVAGLEVGLDLLQLAGRDQIVPDSV